MGLEVRTHLFDEEHFAQTLNETEHLEYMESRGGNSYWIDRFFANTSYLSTIGSTWFIIGWAHLLTISPMSRNSCSRNLWQISCFEWSR